MTKKIVIQFMKYSEIESLTTEQRLEKILEVVKDNKILLLEGRLSKKEEAHLIQKTMEEINDKFRGIELAVFDDKSEQKLGFVRKVKDKIANILLGDREGITLIGPASMIHEIKQNPSQLNQLSLDLNS